MDTSSAIARSAEGPGHLLRKEVLKLRWMGLHADAARLEAECRRVGRDALIPNTMTRGDHRREAA
jgi:hypothetical protein